MDQISVSVSSLVSALEDVRPPHIGAATYVKAALVGIPLVVLAHDLSDYWMPKKCRIPLVDWILRKWRSDPDAKFSHLRILRNLIVFGLFVQLHNESSAEQVTYMTEPHEIVGERLYSAAGTRSMTADIQKARRHAFAAADEVLGPEEMNMAAAEQQMEAALRRRHLREERGQQ